MAEIAAVIFDFGGVMSSSPFEAFARYEAQQGLPDGFIRRVNAANPDNNAWAKLERSEIDVDGFDALFLAESTVLGNPVPGSAILPLLAGDLRPGMIAALKACKAHFRVGCITNNIGGDRDPVVSTAVLDVLALFEQVIESSKVGLRKPDPRIYTMMCELLEVAPAQCIYLDDLGINCKPAAALGMTAIKVTSEAQALRDLSAATGLDFG
jgi:putative hydrolase of the HAD superfamily